MFAFRAALGDEVRRQRGQHRLQWIAVLRPASWAIIAPHRIAR
jgi:hypothetical protein